MTSANYQASILSPLQKCLNRVLEDRLVLAKALQPDQTTLSVHEKSPMMPPETGLVKRLQVRVLARVGQDLT